MAKLKDKPSWTYEDRQVEFLPDSRVKQIITVQDVNELKGLAGWLVRSDWDAGLIGIVCRWPRNYLDED